MESLSWCTSLRDLLKDTDTLLRVWQRRYKSTWQDSNPRPFDFKVWDRKFPISGDFILRAKISNNPAFEISHLKSPIWNRSVEIACLKTALTLWDLFTFLYTLKLPQKIFLGIWFDLKFWILGLTKLLAHLRWNSVLEKVWSQSGK